MLNRYTLDALRKKAPDAEFYGDVLRNAAGLPELGLSMATGLVAQAGTGLGTLAGMGMQKLRGEDVDLDAATDTIEDNAGKFTFAPRSKGAQAAAEGLGRVMEPLDRGMRAVGQKAADVTGSPAVGAGVYTALNVLDPELLAPGAAKIAALRGAGNIARRGAETAVPMGEALARVPKGQRGAYTLEDLAAVEGDYGFRSPTLQAFDKLKSQEQGRVSGKQLLKALQREGAKKEELYWMGLDKVLDTDELLDTADVRKLAEANQPQFEFKTQRGGSPDDDDISQKVSELVSEDSDLEYPQVVYRGTGRHREHVADLDPGESYDRWLRDHRNDLIESETDYYLSEIGEHFDEEQLAEMTDEQKQAWAEDTARESVDEQLSNYDVETDYDSEPTNYDEIYSYWDDRVRNNPENYDLEGGKPDYGEYTVGEAGSEDDANYGVSVGRVRSESRFGKGFADQPRELTIAEEQLRMGDEAPERAPRVFQIEALRRQQRETDPNIGKYRADDKRSHYRDMGKNQMFFTRETDRPAPDWGTVQRGIGVDPDAQFLNIEGENAAPKRPLRLQEESQSDWYQAGRKTGWSDEKGIAKAEAQHVNDRARVEAFQKQALDEVPTALEKPEVRDFINEHKKRVAEMEAIGNDLGYDDTRLKAALEEYDRVAANPDADMGERLSAASNVFGRIYSAAPAGSTVETFADQMRNGLGQLPSMERSPLDTVTASGPFRETPQYRKLALIDALRRAVAEGQQYFAFTPGDIHSKRWGTDSVQFAADPTPEGAGKLRYTVGGDAARQADDNVTALDALQAKADELPGIQVTPDDWRGGFKTFDPYAENAEQEAKRLVEGHLSYGMSEYPNPDAQMAKRAEALLAQFRSMVPPEGMGPPRPPTHYSPRAHGFASYYDPTEQDLLDLIKRAGSGAKIQDIPLEGGTVRGLEFDPALAQALKKGMLLPY